MVKIWQLIGGPLAAGASSHGTTGTMDNPALDVEYVAVAVFEEHKDCLLRTDGAPGAVNLELDRRALECYRSRPQSPPYNTRCP